MRRHDGKWRRSARAIATAALLSLVIGSGSGGCRRQQPDPATTGQTAEQDAGETTVAGPSAPLSGPAQQGKRLFDTEGCRNCHAVHGRGGKIGPDLSDEADKGRSRDWLRTQIRDPKANNPQSVMFPYDYLSSQQVDDLIAYLETLSTTSAPTGTSGAPAPSAPLSPGARQGRQLFDKVGCLGCHMVNGQGGNVGPNLSNIANAGRSRDWLGTQIRNPKAHDPQSIMPAFDQLSDQQVNDLVDYLQTLSTTKTPVEEGGPPRGRQLFDTVGCQECHMVNGQGGNVGPDLSNEGNKGRSRDWLETQIRNPRAHDPNTAMPAWNNLSEQQVDDLVDYLESLKAGQAPGGSATPERQEAAGAGRAPQAFQR